MASSSASSSSSSKRGVSPGRQSSTVKQEKKWPTVDDYRYLAAGLLGPPPKMVKSKSHNASNSEVLYMEKSEQNLIEKDLNMPKNDLELKTMKNLAKEMGRMLAHAKSKGQTNELLQLFKSTLNNFVTDKHHMTTGSNEGSNFKQPSSMRKRTIKSQPPQVKTPSPVQMHRKTHGAMAPRSQHTTVPPSSSSELKHGKANVKTPPSGEYTVMSDRERSVITTTMVTRTKIREPMISVIESSKTNVLHRCYGKQSMKALPIVYKNNKKSNTITANTNQLTTPVKVRTPMKVAKQQKASTSNQQMKTIYENEQFDKSNSLTKSSSMVKRVASSGSTEFTERRSSASTIKNTDTNTIEASQKLQLHVNEDPKLQETKELFIDDSSNTLSEETINNMCKTLQPYTSEQDNSLVQRLTSFWNKKLNASERNTNSDISSTTSSTTYIINVNSENSLGNKGSSSEKISDENLSNSFDIENDNIKISTARTGGSDVDLIDKIQGGSDLPDIKMGLMDELIGVLKTKKNIVKNDANTKNVSVCKKIGDEKMEAKNDDGKSDNLVKVISVINSNDTFSNVSSDGFNGCTDEEVEDEYSTEETAAVDDLDIEDYEEDEDEEVMNPSYDEETIEAVEETCLMRRITVRNFNKSKYDSNEENEANESTSDESCKEPIRDGNNKDQNKSIDNIQQNIIDTECCADVKLVQEEQDHAKCNNDKTINTRNTTTNLKDFGVNCHMNSLTGEKKEIATTVMNVNDIIINLRNLIFAIETIPDDMKTNDVDINSLPIPNKIKQTLLLIFEGGFNRSQTINNLLINTDQKLDSLLQSNECYKNGVNIERQSLSLTFSQGLYYDNFNDKTFGCCTREGTLFTCYIPSTFTIPIFENVVTPIHLILFPTRADYLQSKLSSVPQSISQPSFSNGCSKLEGPDNIPILNGDNCRCMTGMMTKAHSPHFTVFYGTMASNKLISAQGSSQRSFQANSKGKVTRIQDVTAKIIKDNDFGTSKETYTLGLMCMNNDSSNSSDMWQKGNVKIICDNDEVNESCHTNKSFGGSCQEDFVDINLNNDVNTNRNQNCNSSGRRRRFWRQTNLEEENAVQSGGGGDYNLMVTPFPCHRTSSMSVIVSSSVNDSNSLPDIHQIESEREQRSLTSHPSSITKSQVDVDLLSCDVIHEICEEHLSDIDDCVMAEQHQSQENRRKTVSEQCENENKQVDNSVTKFDGNRDENTLTNSDDSLRQDQATSTTDLDIIKTSKRDIGTMVNCSDLNLLQQFCNNSCKEKNFIRKAYDRDYIVLCCKTTVPKTIQVFEQKAIHKKYDLEVLFDNDPNLKEELSNVVDVENLCDKERQLIAVCLMLLKRNTFVFENSLLRIVLQSLEKGASSLWNKTSERFSGRINKAKKRLIGKCHSQTQILISCQYRNLIRIIYTTLISLMLCFVIQRHFCGFALPIRFPW